jgi:putative N6-adenine-specific DNA methylase
MFGLIVTQQHHSFCRFIPGLVRQTNMRNEIFHLPLLTVASLLLWLPTPTTCFVASSSNHLRLPSSLLRTSTSDAISTTETTSSSYLATCIPGLAHVMADELAEIHPGITEISLSGNSAVTFQASREASLMALCWVRTAHRLLELVAESEEPMYDREDLAKFIKNEVNVKDLLGDGQGGLLTLSVKAVLNSPRHLPKDLSHSHYTALGVKNALCDVVRDMRGDRPSVDVENPDLPLVAVMRGDQGAASIALYRSLHPPGSLHKRGYRQGSAIHKAAMKESLAAGLLLEAGWHKKIKNAKEDDEACLRLIDPMAGSGSLVLEAAMIATDIAPGLMRIRCGVPGQSLPPVIRWKSDDNADTAELWKSILLDATQRAKEGVQWMREDPGKLQLFANDIHPGALEIMEASLSTAGLSSLVQTTNKDCYDLEVDTETIPYFVVTNPPWGVRLTDDISESWEGLRHFLRDVCPSNTEAWILSGDKSATGALKLRRNRMIPLKTGDQNLRWIQYTIRGNIPQEEPREETSKVEDSW